MRIRSQSNVEHQCMLRKLFCVAFRNRRSNIQLGRRRFLLFLASALLRPLTAAPPLPWIFGSARHLTLNGSGPGRTGQGRARARAQARAGTCRASAGPRRFGGEGRPRPASCRGATGPGPRTEGCDFRQWDSRLPGSLESGPDSLALCPSFLALSCLPPFSLLFSLSRLRPLGLRSRCLGLA
jgi:hypothetical protein